MRRKDGDPEKPIGEGDGSEEETGASFFGGIEGDEDLDTTGILNA